MDEIGEVLRLRREGHSHEALRLARRLFVEDTAGDPEKKVLTLFWSLYSVWKKCDQPDQKESLAMEILSLPIPANDLKVQRALHVVRRAQDPSAPVVARAKNLSQAGKHEQAAAELEQFLQRHPGNAPAENELAWGIWRHLIELLKEDSLPQHKISCLVRRYAQCRSVQRPSLVHSRMLEAVARAARKGGFSKFCAFLHWWGPEANIREEDLVGKSSDDGRRFSSVVEHVIFAIGKTIEEEPIKEYVDTALKFLQMYVFRYPKEEWFSYYLGLCFCKAGQSEQALRFLVPFARTRSREFWIWQKLATCYSPSEPQHLACLCRSILCGAKEPKFLLTVRQQLAVALRVAGYNAQARHEIESIVQLRKKHGWPIPDQLTSLQNEAWFKTTTAKNGLELFHKLSVQADEVLTHDIPWSRALLDRKDVQGKRGLAANLVVELQSRLEMLKLQMSEYKELERLPMGTPLSVRVVTNCGYKRILTVRQRDGQLWDLLPESCAIVEKVNEQTGVTFLLLETGDACLIRQKYLPEAAQLRPGDFVKTRFIPGNDIKVARTVQRSDYKIKSKYWKEFEGEFKKREKGGGHVGEIFIPDAFLKGITSECRVRGIAVRKLGNDNRCWWCAVLVEKA